MIISIILIYLILLCLYGYVKIKKSVELIVYNNGQLIIQIIIIVSFLLFYILGLRILNLFRVNQILDLNNISFNYNIVLFCFLIYSFRKLVIYFFKVSWFKFHYVMMCENNFSTIVNSKYKFFYYNLIYLPAYYTFKYLIYINYIFIIGLVLVFIYDFFINNLILNYSLWYLKYYSLFKIVYYSYNFMITKQNLLLDYYSYNLLYPGFLETSYFINFSEKNHQFLIEESKKYCSSIILEKSKYKFYLNANTAEMSYFKNLIR